MALRLGSLAGRAREGTDRSESSCVGIGLTTMDRIFRAIIACAVLLLLGAASLYVTNARRPHTSRPHGRGRRSK